MEGGTEGSGDEEREQDIEETESYKTLIRSFKQNIQTVIDSSLVIKSDGLKAAAKAKRFFDNDDHGRTAKILRRKKNTSKKTDQYTTSKTKLSAIPCTEVTEDYYPYDDNNGNVKSICHKIWTKFSQKHQKSPSHINNNVQSCEKFSEEFGLDSTKKLNYSTSDCRNKTLPLDTKHKRYVASEDCRPQRGCLKSQNNNSNNNAFQVLVQKLIGLLQLFLILFKIVGMIVITVICLYCLIALHKPTQAFVSRHTQDFIYPFMRALRIISLPAVRRFPILTDFYEESCLFSNPFYAIDDLDCWPCESVRHVIDLTGFSNFSSAYHHSGIPFIVKDAFKAELGIDNFRQIYSESQELIGKAFVESNNLGLTTLDELFSPDNEQLLKQDDFHLEWKINRVTTARLWRKYFPKPYFIPAATEVSVQHFLFLDQISSRSYPLPLTEFANVFLTQASGSRSIVLIPTEKCKNRCKVVSAVLKSKDILFYNWLFWRPMSIPADACKSRSMSITYIGSFY